MLKSLIFILSLLILHSSIAFAIEVGGHLTQDTTWSPENNPYLVIDNIFVDAGVTLTIQAGTEIKIQSAQLTSYDDYADNFYYQNGNNAAKMLWVDGRIIAEGTEQDSILFTRMQDDFDYYWGCIYIPENGNNTLENMSVFKYCKFEYSGSFGIMVGNVARGAITIRSGYGYIKECTFINNAQALSAYYIIYSMEISHCLFPYDDNINDFVHGLWGNLHLGIGTPEVNFKPALLANNQFIDRRISIGSSYYIDNENNNCGIHTGGIDRTSYFYNNEFTNCNTGIECDNEDSLYIKNNRFIDCDDGVDIDDAYVEITDNYFEGCDLSTGLECSGIIYGNFVNIGRARTPGYLEVFNNVSFNSNSLGIGATFRNISFNNCSSIGNEYAFGGAFWGTYNNCIYIGNNNITQYGINGNPIFRNCILDFELPEECIDGGGNIWVDEQEAQELFEDLTNGDFHLIEGSLAIDAGFDTTSYYYPFDMDYSQRVWDGDNNGSSIIDIGPYEYGAPQLGKITGCITETDSGEFVDYVLLKIDNEPGNFTFADSAGYFEIQLPSGTYDIYAERVFYEDNVIISVTVEDEQTTEVEFNMTCTLPQVSAEDENIPSSIYNIQLSNHPNPFNPDTNIKYCLPNDSNVELT
ncbi:MAG: carboxypeptidase regulatory-like domain-containing protein, partial [Candidatus Cloacimonetes bacterium]|nr:carboxypeptidase regulatory-like domain-containing protein [Candidatus Cloacimonadota bacterium]